MVHAACVGALLETSHRTPNLDYDVLMRLMLCLTDDMEEVERLYRLIPFNVLVGNRGGHAKTLRFRVKLRRMHGLCLRLTIRQETKG